MNFKKLENNLLDMIQEQQVKIGYMSGVTRFYYPLQSLNRLLGTELTEEEMQHAMEKFSDHACDRLGKVTASSKNGRFCITLPPQASDYVHENRKPSEFLVRFIGTVARHGCTLDEVMDVFHAYSEHVHMEKTTGRHEIFSPQNPKSQICNWCTGDTAGADWCGVPGTVGDEVKL